LKQKVQKELRDLMDTKEPKESSMQAGAMPKDMAHLELKTTDSKPDGKFHFYR
jgi:hypothetical protein